MGQKNKKKELKSPTKLKDYFSKLRCNDFSKVISILAPILLSYFDLNISSLVDYKQTPLLNFSLLIVNCYTKYHSYEELFLNVFNYVTDYRNVLQILN